MDVILKYINLNYEKSFKNFTYLPEDSIWKIKNSDVVKIIDKYSLKNIESGIVSYIDPNFQYIKLYNIFIKKYVIVRPNLCHIFYKRKLTQQEEFSKSLENFINNLPNKNTSVKKN